MQYLKWISDQALESAIGKLIQAVEDGRGKAKDQLSRNVIDPFSAAFSMILCNMTSTDWQHHEINRQVDKSLSNAVGVFHQQILSNIPGWMDLNNTNQVDLVNDELKIIAELKNKHNTLNAAGTITLYKKLSELVNSKSSIYKGYTAYYVTIIPKQPNGVDELFYPSDNALGERCKEDAKIKKMDGKRFYSLATGNENALHDLFTVIPKVISAIKSVTIAKRDIETIQNLFNQAYGIH